MTHEFCSIFIQNTVKQRRSLSHMVSPDKFNMTTLCVDNHRQSFYCAMLCKARYMPACGVRPSVRPSVRLFVMFVNHVKTNKHIFEIFLPSGSPLHHSFFFIPNGAAIFRREPPITRASNARGIWKNDDFRPISRSISETVIARWAHEARQFVSIEFSFHPYNI